MKAYELLSNETKWCKNAFARNKRGIGVSIHSNKAASWCVAGAIMKCYGNNGYNHKLRRLGEAFGSRRSGGMSVSYWNDNATHSEVIKVLRELDI